jgi:hypothetical protein
MQDTDNYSQAYALAEAQQLLTQYAAATVVGQGGWAVNTYMDGGPECVVDGYDTKDEALLAAAAVLYGRDYSPGRWRLVAVAFAPYGELYADEDHTDPLWDTAWPSIDVAYAGDWTLQYQVLECAQRVAAAIAVLAYGLEAVQPKAVA